MFNVYINDEGIIPPDAICYIVGKNGIFLKKKLGFLESISRVDEISILKDVNPYAKLDIPKIPKELIYQNVNFLRWVYADLTSEGMSILHFDDEKEKYKSQVPQQWVSGNGISYVKNVTYKKYVKLGSIHSHANFGAFHSGTDKDDEFDWDGLHITIGNVASEKITISACIVANKLRFPVNPIDYMEGITEDLTPGINTYVSWYSLDDINDYPGFPDSWKMFVEKAAEKPKNEYASQTYTQSSPVLSSLLQDYIKKSKEGIDLEEGPCSTCPHREEKIQMQLEDILEMIGDEEDEEVVEWWERESTNKFDDPTGYCKADSSELEPDPPETPSSSIPCFGSKEDFLDEFNHAKPEEGFGN